MDTEHISAENVVVLSEEMNKKPCLELSTDGLDTSLSCVIEAEQSPGTTEDSLGDFGSAPVHRRPFKRVLGDCPDVAEQLPESPVKRLKNESPLYTVSQADEDTVPQAAYRYLTTSYSGQKPYSQSAALQADMHKDPSSQSTTLEKDPSQESCMRLNARLEEMREENHRETFIRPEILMTETYQQVYVCPRSETLLEQHKHACSKSTDTHLPEHTSSGGSEYISETEEDGEEEENGVDSDDSYDDDDDDDDDDSDDDDDDDDDSDDSDGEDGEEKSDTEEEIEEDGGELDGKEEDKGDIDSACIELPESEVCPKALVTYGNNSPNQCSHALDDTKIYHVVPSNGILAQGERGSTMNRDTYSSGLSNSPRIAVVPIFSDRFNATDCEKMTSLCHPMQEKTSSVTHMLDEVTELNKSIEELRQSFQTDFGCCVKDTSGSEDSTLKTSQVQSVTNLLDEVTELVESIDSIQQSMTEDVDYANEASIAFGETKFAETTDSAQRLNETGFDGNKISIESGTELSCSNSQESENPTIKTFFDKPRAQQNDIPMSQPPTRNFPVISYQQTDQLTECTPSSSAMPVICKAMTLSNSWPVKMVEIEHSTEQKLQLFVNDPVSPEDNYADLEYQPPVSVVVDGFSSSISNDEAMSVKATKASDIRSIVCFPQDETVLKGDKHTIAGHETLHGTTYGHEKAWRSANVGLLDSQTSSRLYSVDDILAKKIVSTSPAPLHASAMSKRSEIVYQYPRCKLAFDRKRHRAHGASTKLPWSHSKYRWVKRPQTTHMARQPHAYSYTRAGTSKMDADSQHLLSRPVKPRKPGSASSQYKWVKPSKELPGEPGPSTLGWSAATAQPDHSTCGQVACSVQNPMNTACDDREPRRRVVLSRLEL